MNIKATNLSGCFILEPIIHNDERGEFTKIYNKSLFMEAGISDSIKEQFYTYSKKNVIRGMHFQVPPHDHSKLVTCFSGEIMDVVVDLRKGSKTYGKYDSFRLSKKNGHIVYIPSGMAHGFLSLTDNCGVLYNTSEEYSPSHDKGIHWDSFGFRWPVNKPTVSDRDNNHPILSGFDSPFL